MSTEISFYLVFTLVVLSHYSVLCEEDAWQSLIDQAKQSGIPQETLNEAQSVLEDEAIEQVAVEALGDGPNSLVGWIEEADSEETNRGNQAPVEAPADLPDDEEEEVESPENSPTESPNFAPIEAPELTPTNAPIDPPVLSPTNVARKFAPLKASTNAPLRAPSPAPLRAPSPAPNAASPKA